MATTKNKTTTTTQHANTTQAVTAQAKARANVLAKAKSGIGVTLHSSGAPIKGLHSAVQRTKPKRSMFRVITKMGKHPGIGQCIKRWHLYAVGQTLQHCKVTPGLVPSDVTYYASLGYLTLAQPTDAQYAAGIAAWQKQASAAAKKSA